MMQFMLKKYSVPALILCVISTSNSVLAVEKFPHDALYRIDDVSIIESANIFDKILDTLNPERKKRREEEKKVKKRKPRISLYGLTRNENREIQRLLTTFGYSLDVIDGLPGSQTRSAIRKYQRAEGLKVTGVPSHALLEHMHSKLRSANEPEPAAEEAPDTAIATQNTADETIEAPGQAEKRSWSPGIVVENQQDFGPLPCAFDRDKNACFRKLGLNEEQIAFILAMDPGASKDVFATEYLEFGAVDLVNATTNASPDTISVLLNGNPDLVKINAQPSDLHMRFTDSASKAMLERHPNAGIDTAYRFSGFRKLPDGGQRFVFTFDISECRWCPTLGSALVYIDFDAAGNLVGKKNIGLWDSGHYSSHYAIDDHESDPALLASRPELLKMHLNRRGYDAGPMDEVATPKVSDALKEYQTEHCIPPTGKMDVLTSRIFFKSHNLHQQAPCADASG